MGEAKYIYFTCLKLATVESCLPSFLLSIMYGALKTSTNDEDSPISEGGGHDENTNQSRLEETMDDDEGVFAVGGGSTDAIVAKPSNDREKPPSHPPVKTASYKPF